MLPARTFRVPGVLVTGSGSSEQVGAEIRKLNVARGLIVTDRVLVKLGALEGIHRSLEQNNISGITFEGVFTEPTLDFVSQGLAAYRDNDCNFLLAFGGGSAIDTAKAISVLTANPGAIADYKGIGKIPEKGAPLVAIPTTAGTGSEVTPFTIITDTETDVKMLIGSPFLMPDVAIVDPSLTLSMPPGLTAATGIDALTHAIEAYVSIKSQPMTDIFCLSAIELIAGNLKQAWTDGSNLPAREKTMLGALQAGIAFGNSSVALVHGMARPIGAYFHVPHGASNAAILAEVMAFSLSGNPARYADIAVAMGEVTGGLSDKEAAELSVVAVRRLIEEIEVPSLRQLGVDKARLEELAPRMADDALASGSPGNNPRPATRDEIVALYLSAYGR